MTHKAVVVLENQSAEEDVLKLRPGVNLRIGETKFRSEFGPPTSLELDILTLASAIYASDLAFVREKRSKFQRKIELTIPVTNQRVFQDPRVARGLRYALFRVSHDTWDIKFVQREGTPEPGSTWQRDGEGRVLLFSGGLDSIAAAFLYGEEQEYTYLCSHVTGNRVISDAQQAVFDYLAGKYSGQFSYIPFRVGGLNKAAQGYPFPPDREREDTQRTRSVLFLSLAALIARRRAVGKIVVIAENGQMAIHLPLSVARIGGFSTHTAHPEFVQSMAEVLSVILEYEIAIENPFLYKTKAETIETTVKQHDQIIEHTVSCWKASRVTGELNHCGFCVPCLSRRIALETNGLDLPEYRRDILTEDVSQLPHDDEGKRNLAELIEFVNVFSEPHSEAVLTDKYPALINRYFDPAKAIAMYRRFAREALDVFDRYPSVTAIV